MRSWFKEKRKAKKLTQAQFAELLQINQRTVSHIEQGGRISVDMAKKLAVKLGVMWTKFFD